ncbi:MAG: hypothetical protein QM639_13320 [Rhodocyclaceae bacterium]
MSFLHLTHAANAKPLAKPADPGLLNVARALLSALAPYAIAAAALFIYHEQYFQ